MCMLTSRIVPKLYPKSSKQSKHENGIPWIVPFFMFGMMAGTIYEFIYGISMLWAAGFGIAGVAMGAVIDGVIALVRKKKAKNEGANPVKRIRKFVS